MKLPPLVEFGESPVPDAQFGPGPAPPAEFGHGLLLDAPAPGAAARAPAEVTERTQDPLEGPPRLRLSRGPAPRRRRRRPPRSRIAAAAALLLGLAVLAGVTGAGSPAPAPDGAVRLVPYDALAYVHIPLDSSSRAGRAAAAVGRRLPDWSLLSAVALSRVGAIVSGGQPTSFATDIRPWLGREAGLAFLDTPGAVAGSLLVLDVARREAARRFVGRQGAVPDGAYRGVPELRYPTGAELAFVSHYLVLGQPGSVRSAIDAWRGGASLSALLAYRRASARRPAGDVLDAWLSAAGVRRLLAARRGVIGLIGAVMDSPALEGAGLSVAPAGAGLHVRLRRILDPGLAPVVSPAQTAFSPSLYARLPGDSIAALDVQGLDRLVSRLLVAGGFGGLGGRLGNLLSQLGTALTAEGVNVSDLTSLFHGETVVAVVPNRARGTVSHAASLLLLTRVSDPARASDKLAALEAPLAQLFPPPKSGPGQAALFNDVPVAGITAHQLVLTPGLEFDYAVDHGLLAISTSLDGIAAAVRPGASLSSDPRFRAALGTRPARVTSLLFLDFSQLLTLGERTGLTRGGTLRTLQADLQRIRGVGLTTTGGEADTTAELSFQIP